MTTTAENSSTEQFILCISHPDHPTRGKKKLACPSAESQCAWHAALQSGAAGASRSSSLRHTGTFESAAGIDSRDAQPCFITTVAESRSASTRANDLSVDSAHTRGDASVNAEPWNCARGYMALAAERDEARIQVTALLEHMQTYKRERGAADAQIAQVLKNYSDTRKIEAAEEAMATLKRERKETIKMSDECQVYRDFLRFDSLQRCTSILLLERRM